MARNASLLKWLPALLCAVVFMGGSIVHGDDQPDSAGQPYLPWEEFQEELVRAGHATDTGTLIELARAGADLNHRWLALEILGLRGEAGSIEAVRRIVHDDQEPALIRQTAALALARIAGAEGVAALRDLMLQEPDIERQVVMAAQLAELGDASGYPLVVQAAQSAHPRQRFLSVAALVSQIPLKAAAGLPHPLELLVALADDQDPQVRHEVIIQLPFAVAKGAAQASLESIAERLAAGDPDARVREAAQLLLTGWRFDEHRADDKEAKGS